MYVGDISAIWFVVGVSFVLDALISSGRCICVWRVSMFCDKFVGKCTRIVHIRRILSFLRLRFSFAGCKTSFLRYGTADIPR